MGRRLHFSLPSLASSQDRGLGEVDLPSATLMRFSPKKLGWLWGNLQAERKAGLMEERELERGWWHSQAPPGLSGHLL